MIYYISLYPSPNYFRHFVVEETTPIRAIHKLNYQARQQIKALKEKYPNDEYKKITHAMDIVRATRRYKRRHRDKFASTNCFTCYIHELPLGICWEGQLEMGVLGQYAWNVLPKIPLSAAQDSRD